MKGAISRSPETVTGRILDAAEAEFIRSGFEAASTNAITQAFGGSKATLFRHYPTKLHLIEAVVRRIAGRWRGRIGPDAIAAQEPRDWLGTFAATTLDWILSEDVLFVGRLGIAEGHKLPELRGLFAELASGPLEGMLAAKLARWTAEGRLRCDDPRGDAMRFMDLAISGAVSRALYGVERLDGSARLEHAAAAVDLFLKGRCMQTTLRG